MKVGLYRHLMASCMLGGALMSPLAWGQAVIQSGDVKLGVRTDGALNVPDPGALEYDATGLTYVLNGRDALTPGCWCEAWGGRGCGFIPLRIDRRCNGNAEYRRRQLHLHRIHGHLGGAGR